MRYTVKMFYLDKDWVYKQSLCREFNDLHEALKTLFVLGSRYPKEIVQLSEGNHIIAVYDERGVY